jgi:hypothetical protein
MNELFLRGRFKGHGRVTLTDAQIGGDFDCNGSAFFLDDRYPSINADGITVGGKIILDKSQAQGTVSLKGANVAGDVSFNGGKFDVILLERAVIRGAVFLQAMFKAKEVDLKGASVSSLVDDRASWPTTLGLEGFVYDRFLGGPQDAKSRLDWLKLDTSGGRQPYRQLAKVLEDSGNTDGATQVREALQAKLSAHAWPPFRLLEQSIGYGYQPQNALWGLAGLTALGALLYWRGHRMGTIAPTDKDAAQSVQSGRGLPAYYPRFQPFVFSLENTFPLVKLGQTDKWQPDPEPKPAMRPQRNGRQSFLARTPSARTLRWFFWIQILLGWLLATLFLAAISGIVHHD